ncbi:hypothetical protein LMH87_007364 [Akanthomyces muscarius]|uniref:Ankyrin repeat protein n=1 Tax=Akanthomyces muscarius TaxID=2231603 RepID=A0A9W8UU44_AKAMU|nr:hypothetical protein LMH87_007364 [Akanthomyces muscarius]KAJ4165744.1 hypothetical protein LMH87_007364 [Akanthomyces muscarius]
MLIPITTADNRVDIEKFVNTEIDNAPMNWKYVTSETKGLVKSTLVEKSDGMFRWTYLQWEQLKEYTIGSAIKERLGRLPKTLSDLYDEIYGQCPEGCERTILQRAVRWVLCARKPMDTHVLLSAIRAETTQLGNENSWNKSDINENILKIVCRNLIVLDSELGVWRFPHASVAEHFGGKDEPWIRNAEAEVAVVLINCLTDSCSSAPSVLLSARRDTGLKEWIRILHRRKDKLDNTSNPWHPLQAYTRLSWMDHIHHLSDQDSKCTALVHALKQFLGESPQRVSSAYQIFVKYFMASEPLYALCMEAFTMSMTNSVFGVVALGLHRSLEGWWEKDLDHTLLPDLLLCAISCGRTDLCLDFIRRGCDLNRDVEKIRDTPLGLSIVRRDLELTRLLLQNGANPYRKLLLEAGVDHSIRCNSGHTDHDSDHDSCKFGFGSPLAAAVAQGEVDCARFLLERGAKVNAICESGKYGSALAAAASEGWQNCIDLLIEHGADAKSNLEFGLYGSPLAAAASSDVVDCVRVLIDHGAEVNNYLEFGECGSALAAAILESHLPMVKFLIEEKNADPGKLAYFRPRRKKDEWAWGGEGIREWQEEPWADEVAKYLVHDCNLDAGLLMSLGIPPWRMPVGHRVYPYEPESELRG